MSEAVPVLERDVSFSKSMFNRWCSMQVKASLAGHVIEAPPGKVLQTADGMVYIADLHGVLHVARDEQGRKLKPEKARIARFLAREGAAKATTPPTDADGRPESVSRRSAALIETGDSTVRGRVEIVPPGASQSEIQGTNEAETPESGK